MPKFLPIGLTIKPRTEYTTTIIGKYEPLNKFSFSTLLLSSQLDFKTFKMDHGFTVFNFAIQRYFAMSKCFRSKYQVGQLTFYQYFGGYNLTTMLLPTQTMLN